MNLRRSKSQFNPAMHFPAQDQAVVSKHYTAANAILEYGSGGSTVLAAELGKPVVSVESDSAWAKQMNALLASRHPNAQATVQHVNIGKTGKWGKPLRPDGALNYHSYPMSVWDSKGFHHPDVILIDGRFRVACFCTTLLRLKKPATILFDDYNGRDRYQIVERLLKPIEQHERMAVFEANPTQIPTDEWAWIIQSFFQTTYAKKRAFWS
jgi:hypothetical protein